MQTHNSPSHRVPVASFLAGVGVGVLVDLAAPPPEVAVLAAMVLVIGGVLLALVVDHPGDL